MTMGSYVAKAIANVVLIEHAWVTVAEIGMFAVAVAANTIFERINKGAICQNRYLFLIMIFNFY